ncbi:MAG: sugar ABC transporter permease, partial [Pseudomonadota bacterium]
MTAMTPPRGVGPLQRREARLAWSLLLPTIAIVSLVVILPLLAIFWISVKPIGLADLRPAAPILREALRGSGDDLRIEYRLRNSSQDVELSGVA